MKKKRIDKIITLHNNKINKTLRDKVRIYL